jgi:ABC-type antimicrobial peptide transport system permease subunit
VDPVDPIAVGTPLLLMLVAGVCAGLIPSVRASNIDPAKALRQE